MLGWVAVELQQRVSIVSELDDYGAKFPKAAGNMPLGIQLLNAKDTSQYRPFLRGMTV